jgi:hypothetical protein
MKLSLENIRKMVSVQGRPMMKADDGFHTLSYGMHNDVSEDPNMGDLNLYHLSRFRLIFEQLVTHRPQEGEAVKANVARTIHNALYRDIIVKLQRLRHEAEFAPRDEVLDALSRIIDYIEE